MFLKWRSTKSMIGGHYYIYLYDIYIHIYCAYIDVRKRDSFRNKCDNIDMAQLKKLLTADLFLARMVIFFLFLFVGQTRSAQDGCATSLLDNGIFLYFSSTFLKMKGPNFKIFETVAVTINHAL